MPRTGGLGVEVEVPRRKQRVEFRFDGAHLLPAPLNLRQQLGAIAADRLRSAPGVEELVE
jgi:hypothetical protein